MKTQQGFAKPKAPVPAHAGRAFSISMQREGVSLIYFNNCTYASVTPLAPPVAPWASQTSITPFHAVPQITQPGPPISPILARPRGQPLPPARSCPSTLPSLSGSLRCPRFLVLCREIFPNATAAWLPVSISPPPHTLIPRPLGSLFESPLMPRLPGSLFEPLLMPREPRFPCVNLISYHVSFSPFKQRESPLPRPPVPPLGGLLHPFSPSRPRPIHTCKPSVVSRLFLPCTHASERSYIHTLTSQRLCAIHSKKSHLQNSGRRKT